MLMRLLQLAPLLLATAEGQGKGSLLGRAAALDAWFTHNATPATWTVRGPRDVKKPWRLLAGGAQKRVYRATVGGATVVVKSEVNQSQADLGGGTLYMEMLYMEALRGAPGVPVLYGAWRDGPHVTYVAHSCGEPISTHNSTRRSPSLMSPSFAKRATEHPLRLARSLLECFRSWTQAGFVQTDFKGEQFTLDDQGDVYLVDGPRATATSPLGQSVQEAWGRRAGHLLNRHEQACAGPDRDCRGQRATAQEKCLRGEAACDPGARDAPESLGKCHDHVCLVLSGATHVFDVANRPWLLPYIAAHATGADRDLLLAVIRRASAEDPDDRPSFAEILASIDRHEASTREVVLIDRHETSTREGPAASIDRFYTARAPPPTWTVRNKSDVTERDPTGIASTHVKKVYRASCAGWPVVVKKYGKADFGFVGGPLYMELVYLEALRGRPGIPELYGAWFNKEQRVTYVVGDAGAPIGFRYDCGLSAKAHRLCRSKEILPSEAFTKRARKHPLKLTKALLSCFGSWASAGWFMDDFQPAQFTMDGQGSIFLVDGPRALSTSPIGQSVVHAWGNASQIQDNSERRCARHADCPHTHYSHSCVNASTCEPGATGAPEAVGKCRDDTCIPLSEKTHVFDVANRPWLLPGIADLATGAERDLLRSLIRAASAGNPEDRPSFRELVDRIDHFDSATVIRPSAIDRFYTDHAPPATWTVSNGSDVTEWRPIGTASKAKEVYRASFKGRPVVVKKNRKSIDAGGGTLYMELVYLEALRGRPGIPELYGAWFDGRERITYVVGDAGAPIGFRAHPSVTHSRKSLLSEAFEERARKHPLELARSLLACFQSWASVGWFLDDFRPDQFTMDGQGSIFLVDGPRALSTSPVGQSVGHTWGRASQIQDNSERRCARHADCPHTHYSHSCRKNHSDASTCEPGATGAPEAVGKCRDDTCIPLSEKTHVFDVANRPWLLPGIADLATSPDHRAVLRTLIRAANQTRPEDRPSFADLVARVPTK